MRGLPVSQLEFSCSAPLLYPFSVHSPPLLFSSSAGPFTPRFLVWLPAQGPCYPCRQPPMLDMCRFCMAMSQSVQPLEGVLSRLLSISLFSNSRSQLDLLRLQRLTSET